MNKKRVFSAILFFAFCGFLLFARQGYMSGKGRLRVSQTEWFDIIYEESSQTAAAILYQNADNILQELAASYGYDCSKVFRRFPVVITRDVEQYNAYFTNSPYNHIVLFDTAEISDLAVFSKTILSVFTHELTHAVTYNLKVPALIKVSKIFGDFLSYSFFTVTSGMAEGATVSYESSKGEGRLNDPFALQMVRQAKIEDSFPKYSDVKGASDAYPGGSFYYFNGAFAEYLQRTYGMEKYAQFWMRCINIAFSAGGAFKKVYGIKINKAWKDFCDQYSVPQVAVKNAVKEGYAKDFFDASAVNYSIQNNAGALYSNLNVIPQGIVYFDSSNRYVYFVSKEQLEAQAQKGEPLSPKRLFHKDYLDYISVSSDGRFIVAGHYSNTDSNIKHTAGVYDMQTKKWHEFEETNIVNPLVVCRAGQYYFVAQKYNSPNYSIIVKELDSSTGKLSALNSAVLDFELYTVPGSFIDLGQGHLAFTKKTGLEYSICVCNLDFSNLKEYKMPLEDMRIQSISFDGSDSLLFTWATNETLPRAGMLSLSTGLYSLCEQNISGGMYSPVVYNGQLYYTGEFYRQNRIFSKPFDELKLAQYQAPGLSVDITLSAVSDDLDEAAPQAGMTFEVTQVTPSIIGPAIPDIQAIQLAQIPYDEYSPFKYFYGGILLPVSNFSSKNFVSMGSSNFYEIGLGLTYLTSLPWDTGLFLTSAGYSLSTNSGLFGFEYSGGTGTSILGYSLDSYIEIDGSGFKQTHGGAAVSSSFDFGRRSMFGLSAKAQADYGRVSYVDSKGKVVNSSSDVYFKTVQAASAVYSNQIKWGPGTYEHSGITFSTSLLHNLQQKAKPDKSNIMNYYDWSFDLSGRIPRLLPFSCRDNYTYNFPLKFDLSLFDFEHSLTTPAALEAEILLFSHDIQKAVSFISALFINDITVSLRYNAQLDFSSMATASLNWRFLNTPQYINHIKNGKYEYADYFSIRFKTGFTPNIGNYANSDNRFNFCIYYCFGNPKYLPQEVLNIGFEAKF